MRKRDVQMTNGNKIRVSILALSVFMAAGWLSSAALAAGRILAKQDTVVIKVVSQPDMDTTTRVGADGTIEFPYVGRIKAAGRSEDDLARTIEQRLAARQIVTDPHVLVETTTFGTQATIQGEVNAPGAFTLDRATTLTQFLSKAGGLKETAGEVIIRRNGRIIGRYNGPDIVSGKIDANRILIQDNDEVYVELGPFYYVYGFVGHTGEFPLLRPVTVQQALAIAGGLTPLGTESRLKIKRKSGNGQTVEVPASLDDQVEPNDTIIVNERIF